MTLRLPRVFLSSTFYDLRHLRDELRRFITETLGYEVLASEHFSFPTDPDADTIENCVRRVREEADVLVLIVGGRYGHVPADKDRSVTNMEYVTARAKGIPIYAFVLKDVLDILPIYARSPDADFFGVVETPRLLEFVKELRSEDRIWVFPFETGEHIIDTLRAQFGYRLAAGLEAELRMRSEPEGLRSLGGEALRLVVDKPSGWKGLFFAELLREQLDRHRAAYDAYRSGASWGPGEAVPVEDTQAWVSRRMGEIIRLSQGMTQVVNETLNDAMKAEDIRQMRSVAEVLGDAFSSAIAWATSVRRAHVAGECNSLRDILSKAPDDMIQSIAGFPKQMRSQVEQALMADGDTKVIELDLTMRVGGDWVGKVTDEIDRLKRHHMVR